MQMLRMARAALCVIRAFTCVAPLIAQSPENLDLSAVGKDPRWKIAGRTTSVVDAKGRRALRLSEGPGTGSTFEVWLPALDE